MFLRHYLVVVVMTVAMPMAVVVLLGGLVDHRRFGGIGDTILGMANERPARALIVTRLSRMQDNTTSPERQVQACRELVSQRGYDEVSIAEDLDISGSIDPFNRKKRPELASWLHDRSNEFDVIVVYRLDRLTRNTIYLNKVFAWCLEHGKTVVSATESIDLSTAQGRLIANVVGFLAEGELEAIRERTKSSANHLIKTGRYRGSVPPWGYRPDKSSGDWRLIPDPDQARVIHEVASRVIGAESLNSIAHDLTRRGIKTPKGNDWSSTPLKRSLMSEAMLGRVTDRSGKAIRGNDGSPIQRAEPVLDRDVWTQVREVLASRSRGTKPASQGSLLTRVIFCGMPGCGRPAYSFLSGGGRSKHRRFRCQTMSSARKCGNRTIRADEISELIEKGVLAMLADSERMVKVWEAGSDSADDLAELDELLADLTDQLGTGQFKRGTPQRERLDERIRLLADRRAELASQPSKPSGWHWVSTGEMFGPWWAQQTVEARNAWLRSARVRVEFDREQIRIEYGDLQTMLRELSAGDTARTMQEMFATMFANGIQGITIGTDGAVEITPKGA